MTIFKKATTVPAMKIAGYDRQRFNDAVREGYFECAPPTQAGAPRYFDRVDILGVFIFARLMDFRLHPQQAGRLACSAMFRFRDHPKSERYWVVMPLDSAEPIGLLDIEGGGKASNAYAFRIEFSLTNIMAEIERRIEEEAGILRGGDDE